MRRYRCEVETDDDKDPLQWWTTRSEFEILAATVLCEHLYLFHCQQEAVGTGAI